MSFESNENLKKFQGILSGAENVVILTGAGISAESGIPTFRGTGGVWRKYSVTDIATVDAFSKSPSLVWQFYEYARELVLSKEPNQAHYAIAKAEEAMEKAGRNLTVITQNVDGLHQKAGSKNVIELHGSLFKTQCCACGEIADNSDVPICPALLGKGAPDGESEDIPTDQLPSCDSCRGLLRPYTVWFGESLDEDVIRRAGVALTDCDACLVIGTSSVVYPAAMFAPALAQRKVPVAEFNIENTQVTGAFMFHFHGPASETVPVALEGIAQGELTPKVPRDSSNCVMQ